MLKIPPKPPEPRIRSHQRKHINDEYWCCKCNCIIPPNEVETKNGREIHVECGGIVVIVEDND